MCGSCVDFTIDYAILSMISRMPQSQCAHAQSLTLKDATFILRSFCVSKLRRKCLLVFILENAVG